MDLARVITGQIVTEKAERQKAQHRTYTLKIDAAATKIDVTNALEALFDVQVVSVRVLWLGPKTRALSGSNFMTKRHRSKRAIVTLGEKSKALDLTNLKLS